ncbi:glycosyltransferase family 2 protein [Bradyrhizobium rifense]|uniref:Glycosyltransferase family 2 protein n=1 Tax=Bradyrhizobium rifense TaxID=515499 RepID=A0A5D3KE02_9BRAD|nr:glycosyltransferase family A protein [Bradyrhizobium rifense]TYL88338.1 glycosyltransferase family 2 protein [Bradyrhizobium rifense]
MGPDWPLFSVIIPLRDHRGQWEQCWLGWTSQTVDRSLYEIILVMPPDFTAHAELKALVAGQARLESTDCVHDIELSAIGAARARGRYLFFTESHCWPEPDVIELCIRAIDDHPDWVGFSCRSLPICHNRLSEAEAAMYQADIDFGLKQHPWRKVLDQCFVTRRDVYEECGGLREEFGHFAEWVLAAGYFARGYAVGYLEEARFHHYYVGRIGELKTFTLDFVQGEIRYLSGDRRDPGWELLEIPHEWSERDNVDDDALALHALNALMRYRGWKRPDEKLRASWRWIAPALFGDLHARVAARLAVAHARTMLTALAVVGSSDAMARWMRRYISSLIRFQRLESIRRTRGHARLAPKLLGDHVLAELGFHAVETAAGHTFRWSEPQAAVRIKGLPGRNTVCIRSPALRAPLDEIGTQFYFDGARVDPAAIDIGCDRYTLNLDLPKSGVATLAWACPVLKGVGDVRRLGLSVVAIDVSQDACDRDQKDSGLSAAISRVR